MQTARLFTALSATALLMSCGGDDGDGGDGGGAADSPLAAAIAADIVAEEDPITTDPGEAQCWAGRIVGDVGEDRLNELGVTVESVGDIADYDFTDPEIESMVDSMFDCIDVKAAFASSMAEDFGEEGAGCVAERLDEDFVRQAMTSAIRGVDEPSDEFLQAFLDIAAECDLPLGG